MFTNSGDSEGKRQKKKTYLSSGWNCHCRSIRLLYVCQTKACRDINTVVSKCVQYMLGHTS